MEKMIAMSAVILGLSTPLVSFAAMEHGSMKKL